VNEGAASIFNMITVFLTVFSFGYEQCALAAPVEKRSAATLEMNAKRRIEHAAANAGSLVELIWMGAMNGVSEKSLRIVRDDLEHTLGKSPWPHVQIKKNAFFSDGKATGIRIQSYAPFNITFQGKAWGHDRNRTVEENYFSLVKFLSPPKAAKSASVLEMLVPSAIAGTTGNIVSTATGGVIGAIPGIALAAETLLLSPLVLTVGGMAALFGVNYSGYNRLKNRKYVSDVLCSGRLRIDECSPKLVSMTLENPDRTDKRRISIDSSAGKESEPVFHVFDNSGGTVSTDVYDRQLDVMKYLAQACRQSGDQNLVSQWKKGIKVACTDHLGNPWTTLNTPMLYDPEKSISEPGAESGVE
jgi:hypothetical protein